MPHSFCPGYAADPFVQLVADYPDVQVYPASDFRVEWGPVFHRGRLDGSAAVLLLGQDPAQHETIARRILVGVAGQRVQGLLARLGVTSSYVLVNTFLYSVYGQGGGERHRKDPGIADYRNRWLDALLVDTQVRAVVTLGSLAAVAYRDWAKTRPLTAAGLHQAKLRHPTYPEGAGRANPGSIPANTATMLAEWSAALPGLRAAIIPDDPATPADPTPYGATWAPGDLVPIPEEDLPAGSPAWMRSLEPWAARTGANASDKRATITVTVPATQRPWET